MIKDQPNHTNHIKEPQSSHCLVVHEDAYLNYKRYKVAKFCFKSHPRVPKYQYTQTYTVFVFFKNFNFFIYLFLKVIKEIKINAYKKINAKTMQCMKA